MSVQTLKVLTNGGNRNGTTMDSTGLFLDFETAFATKASYLTVYNRGATYSVLINFNTSVLDAVAAINKTVVVAPEKSITIADEDISNATIFCSGAETSLADYVMGKRNYMRGGA